jgi:hypothetical protein
MQSEATIEANVHLDLPHLLPDSEGQLPKVFTGRLPKGTLPLHIVFALALASEDRHFKELRKKPALYLRLAIVKLFSHVCRPFAPLVSFHTMST